MSAVAGNGVQRQIDAVPPESRIDPSHRLILPKIVTESR
jgi:hypothetical protein